jgi:hypothetical protein
VGRVARNKPLRLKNLRGERQGRAYGMARLARPCCSRCAPPLCVRLAEDGTAVRHRYWGAALPQASVARLAAAATGQDHTGAGLLQAGLDLPGGAGFGSTLVRLVRL